MNADFERKIGRWLNEFNDLYLSEHCLEYTWREVNGKIIFSFTYKVTGGAVLFVTVDTMTVEEVETIEDSLCFARILQNKLTEDILEYFYRARA